MSAKASQKKQRQMIVFGSIFIVTVLVLSAFATAFFTPQETEKVASVDKTATAESVGFTPAEITSPYEIVINRSYPIAADYIGGSGILTDIGGGFQLETEAAAALEKMRDAMGEDGLTVSIKSAYRTDVDQELLYERQIQRQNGDEVKAATVSALPLTSEHQAGLAVDFTTDGNLDSDFANTKQGQWLKEHCVEYGYILRYPEDKMEVTGIIWEPWHFRYVGSAKTAKAITDSGLTMDEYYGKTLKAEDLEEYLPYLQV